MTLPRTHALFDGLLPSSVIVRCRDPREELPVGTPEEEALIVRAVDKRKREFRAGRACAHEAIATLGVAKSPLLTGNDREPRWPAGVVGSISHSNLLCVAAVARADVLRAVGVDTEIDEPLPAALIPKVCTEREARGSFHKQIFSAKETTYKCLHPIVKKFFGFHAAEIALEADRFHVTLLVDLAPFAKGARFTGRHRTEDGLIATALWIDL